MRTVIFIGLIKIAEVIYLTAKTDGKFLGEIEVKLYASILIAAVIMDIFDFIGGLFR